MFDKAKLLFTAKKPPDNELDRYIGRTVIVPTFADINGKRTMISEEKVTIKTLCGNRFHQAFFEINGKHRIGMLRFYKQMNNAKDITEEECQAFDEMILSSEVINKKEAMDGQSKTDKEDGRP